jgi:hypothetical protein
MMRAARLRRTWINESSERKHAGRGDDSEDPHFILPVPHRYR